MSAVRPNMASGGCQKKRLNPYRLSTRVTTQAQTAPALMTNTTGGR